MKEEKKELYQKWWFWLCVVLGLCVVAVFNIMINSKNETTMGTTTNTTYLDTKYNDTVYENFYNNEIRLKENIKVEYAGITKFGDFVIKVTNNNNVPVQIREITTIYKDSNDTFMKKETSKDKYFSVEANSEVYVRNWGYEENFEQYPKYEFDFGFSGSLNFANSVIGSYEIKANNTGKNIALEIQNNNSEAIDNVIVGVVFYKENQIVGYENGYDYDNTTGSGKSAYINVDYPKDSNFKKVDFDNYKVYILNAGKAN